MSEKLAEMARENQYPYLIAYHSDDDKDYKALNDAIVKLGNEFCLPESFKSLPGLCQY